jgi:hypothetical protein
MVVRNLHFFALVVFMASFTESAFSQDDRKDKTPVTYEELYDEPYSIKKLFVGLQPLYGELFAANVNAGFGLEVTYFMNEKYDFKAAYRRSYTSAFFDFNREQADRNGDTDNSPKGFNYFEIGGTYHIKDFETTSKTKMFLYKKSYAGNKWASRVPLNAEVPCKVRKIYGARLGATLWSSTIDVDRAIEKQDLALEDFENVSTDGYYANLADAINDPTNFRDDESNLFTNVNVAGLYVGGSMSWIRNVAVSFDKFESGVDDLIFTAYVDILISPSVKLEDVKYTPQDEFGTDIVANRGTYTISPVGISKFGFRAGMDGKFNRKLSWSYGGEVGMRPAIQGTMFYALLKISFPVFGTNADYKVESFGK